MTFDHLLVAHDAGGANALLSLICNKINYHALASGPAAKILSKLGNIELIEEYNLFEYDMILLATGFEKTWLDILSQCNEHNLNYSVVLDHWSNYQRRFELNGVLVMPNHITTLDSYATGLIGKVFPNAKVVQKKNIHLEKQKRYVWAKRKRVLKSNILFIGEYTNYFLTKFGKYYEQVLFEQFCEYMINMKENSRLVLRLHPSEERGKYSSLNTNYHYEISNNSLEDDLAAAHLVVGHDSHALFLAHEIGIPCERLCLSNHYVYYQLPIDLPVLFLACDQ